MNLADLASQLLWPVSTLLFVMVASRRLATDVRPIFVNVINGVAQNANSNAPAYAIAILFGLSASLSAFVDVFKEMSVAALHSLSWHQYLVLWAKVANPFIVAILAYATQNKFKGGNAVAATTTTPPYPPSSP